jgi:hypothetical protein
MYIKNNILYLSLKEAKEIENRKNKNKSKEEIEKEKAYKKWIYDWDRNSMGYILNH